MSCGQRPESWGCRRGIDTYYRYMVEMDGMDGVDETE